MTYAPLHQPQLDRGTPVPGRTQGSRDCGPRTWQMGIDFLTRGGKVPDIAELRRRGQVSGPQRTDVNDARLAVQSYDSIRGRRPLRLYVKTYLGDVSAAVRAGKYVLACIDYGVLNDRLARTGDPAFRDGHSVGLLGHRVMGGEVQWRLWDPLDDGRRAGIPEGPRWVDKADLVAAMEAFAGGSGRCWAGVFGGGQPR